MGRAIVRNPQVFLFDEPLSNLDAKLRVQMRSEIKELHQRLKVTTVYVTHDQIEAMTMADKIVVMNNGNIEQAGAPLELYDRPANLFVAGFIGSPAMNMLDGRHRRRRRSIADGGAQLAAAADAPRNGAGYLRHPPRASAPATAGDGGIAATVQLVEPTGSETQVMMRIGDDAVDRRLPRARFRAPGETIRVAPDSASFTCSTKGTGQRLAS